MSKERVKIGLFGLWSGYAFQEILKQMTADTVIYALCERDKGLMQRGIENAPKDVKICETYEELLDSGIDAVILSNAFNNHAPYAIKALDKGIHVLSECTAASTMKECVELCEAVERSSAKYMLIENYPYTAPMMEIARLYRGGSLGHMKYCEGEYNHPFDLDTYKALSPRPDHWRRYVPATYYITHALGPLMQISGQFPVRISGFSAYSQHHADYLKDFHNELPDLVGMMTAQTNEGGIFRFNGWSHMPSHSAYRFCGEIGSCETGRAYGESVFVNYNEWEKPKEVFDDLLDRLADGRIRSMSYGGGSSASYTPAFEEHDDIARNASHSGGDFWVLHNFIDYIRDDVHPFFDVYAACAMSACAILGWRSCLEGGRVYDIPDFKNAEERNKWRDDALTPFPDESGKRTLPVNSIEKI